MPRTERNKDAIDWSLTTWEGARREQLRRWSELSLEEIIRPQDETVEVPCMDMMSEVFPTRVGMNRNAPCASRL